MYVFFFNVYLFLSFSLYSLLLLRRGPYLYCIERKKMFQIFYSAETLYALFLFFRLDFWTFSNQNLNQFCQRFCCSDIFMSYFELKRFKTIPLYAFFQNKHNRMMGQREKKIFYHSGPTKMSMEIKSVAYSMHSQNIERKKRKKITRKWPNLNAERKIVRKKYKMQWKRPKTVRLF